MGKRRDFGQDVKDQYSSWKSRVVLPFSAADRVRTARQGRAVDVIVLLP